LKVSEIIEQTGEEEAVLDALMQITKMTKTELYLAKEIDEEVIDSVLDIIEQYKGGTPLAYLLGKTYFCNEYFFINDKVLVPRQETEGLVLTAMEEVTKDMIRGVEEERQKGKYSVLDLCTGSGCVGISIALLHKSLNKDIHFNHSLKVTASDISKPAVLLARQNQKLHSVGNIEIIMSNLFDEIKGKFDLIVCNPPYVKTFEIGIEDKRILREPRIALDGGLDGLYFYRKILTESKKYLKKDGSIIFEIGNKQGHDVTQIAFENKFRKVEIRKDIANIDRICIVRQ
jgi:release factor glutamine methyltransferase